MVVRAGQGFHGTANQSSALLIKNSLGFRGAQYLSRTPATGGNQKTYTYSFWTKGLAGGTDYGFLIVRQNVTPYFSINTNQTTDVLDFQSNNFGGNFTAKYRDPSAWYHFVLKVDTTQATQSERVVCYVNGVRQPNYANSGNIAQNVDTLVNSTTKHSIGADNSYSYSWMEAYMSEVHMVDGTALDPTNFGEYNANGVWIPKRYSGSYGTNGFYLKFDPDATNGIGHDHSGNGNNFTANNFDTTNTTASTYDVMSDTPTTNYSTLNPLDNSLNMSSSFYVDSGNLNLTVTNNSGYRNVGATFSPEGQKGYFEITWTTSASPNFYIGFMPASRAGARNINDYQYTGRGYGLWSYGYVEEGVTDVWTNYLSAFGSSDTLQIAFDFTGGNRNVWFGRNNTWGSTSGGTGNPATGANPALTATQLDSPQAFSFAINTGAGTQTIACNFGQRAFNYTPPTGFKALNTANLPAPTIKDGSDNFNTVLWTGNSVSGRAVTGVGFQPDFLWVKYRNGTASSYLQNSVTGATNYMFSDDTVQERNLDDSVHSFDTDGFTVGNDGAVNYSGGSYVGWNWLAGGSGSSNTDGSITSTVSVNATAGFSIVSYTGNATSSQTVGHGLGVAPSMVIVKNRDRVASWLIRHSSLATNKTPLLENNTGGITTNYWESTHPSSTVFTISSNNEANASGEDLIAYCFAEVEGYSKFGSYTGNGSSDGPFVATSFAPAWILLKRTDTTGNWILLDNRRYGYNSSVSPRELYANLSNTEADSNAADFLSNGFKLRVTFGSYNASGGTYIFAAFAENPFGGSGVSPATAR